MPVNFRGGVYEFTKKARNMGFFFMVEFLCWFFFLVDPFITERQLEILLSV